MSWLMFLVDGCHVSQIADCKIVVDTFVHLGGRFHSGIAGILWYICYGVCCFSFPWLTVLPECHFLVNYTWINRRDNSWCFLCKDLTCSGHIFSGVILNTILLAFYDTFQTNAFLLCCSFQGNQIDIAKLEGYWHVHDNFILTTCLYCFYDQKNCLYFLVWKDEPGKPSIFGRSKFAWVWRCRTQEKEIQERRIFQWWRGVGWLKRFGHFFPQRSFFMYTWYFDDNNFKDP